MRALFLTWDGPQQTYLESLFFPIFAGLRGRGIDVHTLQLTWCEPRQVAPVRLASERLGLAYSSRHVPQHLRKVALPAAVGLGATTALRYLTEHRVDTLMPRSLIPMSMALLAQRARTGIDLVFEADGLMADERVDFGGWSERGASYRLLRRVEASGVRRARSVICRTHAAKDILAERAGAGVSEKIFVAPNAKDSAVFSTGSPAERQLTRARYGIAADAPWIVYVGSIGPQYLPSLMLAAMARVKQRLPQARFTLLSLHADALQPLLAPHRELAASLDVRPAAPADVPEILAAADLGFAPRLESFSQRGICPIKVAEYLLCGVPVVTSAVGDLALQLGSDPATLVLRAPNDDAPERIAQWFENTVWPAREERRESARRLGLKWFDLAQAIDRYEAMLRYRRPEGVS